MFCSRNIILNRSVVYVTLGSSCLLVLIFMFAHHEDKNRIYNNEVARRIQRFTAQRNISKETSKIKQATLGNKVETGQPELDIVRAHSKIRQSTLGNKVDTGQPELDILRTNSKIRQSSLGNEVDTGQPELDILRANSVSFDLASANIDEMSDQQVELTFHSYLDNTNIVCKRSLRMGNIEDGGWEVCDDPHVRPVPPCVVYSFGIHNDWSFDDDVSRLYRCHVFSFDPSMKVGHFNRSELVHFYQWGISGSTRIDGNEWMLYSLSDLRERLGHASTPIDVLKMDVEKSEWPTLKNMVATNQFADIRQLLVEFHLSRLIPASAKEMLKSIQEIEKAGFRKFNVHKNGYCNKTVQGFPVSRTKCYEVHYMKEQ